MPRHIALFKERLSGLIFGAWIGIILAAGFIPATARIADFFTPLVYGRMILFPLLSFLFFSSLPKREKTGKGKLSWIAVLEMLVIPTFLALVFGYFHLTPGVFHSPDIPNMLWLWLSIPIGEELLFRGWVFNIAERIWKDRLFTLTNALPVSCWVSATAFSFWHLQNISVEPWGLVLFQMVYTFFTGLWFGYLRWKSSGLRQAILSHAALNIAASLL